MRHPHHHPRIRVVCILQILFLVVFVAHLVVQAIFFTKSSVARKVQTYVSRNVTTEQGRDITPSNEPVVPNSSDVASEFVRSEGFAAVARSSIGDSLLRETEFRQLRLKSWLELSSSTEKMASEQCENDFGFGLVRRWKAAQKVWCSPSITCHALMQTGHGGNGDNLCVLRNSSFNPAPYNDEQITQALILKYRDTSHEDEAYMHHSTPILGTQCSKVENVWRDDQLPGWNREWMVGGLATDNQIPCQSFEEKTLIIVQRDSFANLYHDSEDFFNIFLALLITELRPDQVRVLLADLYPWGPFESFWKHLFPDVRTAWEMRAEPPRCYRQIIVGIFGPASPLTLINERSNCFSSPLVRAYTRWAWSSFGLEPVRRQENRTRVVWMSRLRSVMWPERAYCDERYFRCADWTHLEVRAIGRVLANDADVVAALAARRELDVRGADFNKLPFVEQVAMVVSSDVLAGPHGAGLTHLLFLPDWGCVYELFIDGSESNIHFANLATWRGLAYHSVVAENPVPPDSVAHGVVAACHPR